MGKERSEAGAVKDAVRRICDEHGVSEGDAAGAILLFGVDADPHLIDEVKNVGVLRCAPMAIAILRARCASAEMAARDALGVAAVSAAIAIATVVAACVFAAGL